MSRGGFDQSVALLKVKLKYLHGHHFDQLAHHCTDYSGPIALVHACYF